MKIPTGKQCSGWPPRKWAKFLSKNGWVIERRVTHGFFYVHPSGARFMIPRDTNQDVRAALNLRAALIQVCKDAGLTSK